MLEYRGIDAALQFFAAATFRPDRSYRVVPTRANGEPAFGMFLADPHTGVFRAYGLLVVTIAGDRIGAVTGFDASVMPRFGRPRAASRNGLNYQFEPLPLPAELCQDQAGVGTARLG